MFHFFPLKLEVLVLFTLEGGRKIMVLQPFSLAHYTIKFIINEKIEDNEINYESLFSVAGGKCS